MIAEDFPLVAGQMLRSPSNAYIILNFVGEGSFGKVAQCQVHGSDEIVAVKILKEEIKEAVDHELDMLEAISRLNGDQINVVKLYERFQHCGHTCLVFERLDISLFQQHLMGGSLNLHTIRPIAKQLLETLQALQYLGIMHSDIKPDNVMLVDRCFPFRVKLIDFGNAIHFYSAKLGGIHQAIGYRAPEVILGLPYTEAIDMWGLGCVLAFLFLGFHLFPVDCEHLMLMSMVNILGMPSNHQLQKGVYSRYFFCEKYGSGKKWRLLSRREYSFINKKRARKWPKNHFFFTSLDDLVNLYESRELAEMFDRIVFIDFLKKMLHMNWKKRISPTEALQHPFITMSHLSHDKRCRGYVRKAQAYFYGDIGYFTR